MGLVGKLLLLLAVLFAPALTSMAAAHAGLDDHQMQMMETGYCSSMPSSHHDKSDGKSCCISMYIGVAIAPAAPTEKVDLRASPPIFFVAPLHRPYLGEIATPPPRRS